MNIHKNARLTLARRIEMVKDITLRGMSACMAAQMHGVTAPTARKWLGRYLALGEAGMADVSSRPAVSPRAIDPAKALAVVELRHKRLTQARIAAALGISKSTVCRVLARAGLSRLPPLHPQCLAATQAVRPKWRPPAVARGRETVRSEGPVTTHLPRPTAPCPLGVLR